MSQANLIVTSSPKHKIVCSICSNQWTGWNQWWLVLLCIVTHSCQWELSLNFIVCSSVRILILIMLWVIPHTKDWCTSLIIIHSHSWRYAIWWRLGVEISHPKYEFPAVEKQAIFFLDFPEFGVYVKPIEEQTAFWEKLTKLKEFEPKSSPYSIDTTVWQYVHRFISNNVNFELDTVDYVTLEDLKLMWVLD